MGGSARPMPLGRTAYADHYRTSRSLAAKVRGRKQRPSPVMRAMRASRGRPRSRNYLSRHITSKQCRRQQLLRSERNPRSSGGLGHGRIPRPVTGGHIARGREAGWRGAGARSSTKRDGRHGGAACRDSIRLRGPPSARKPRRPWACHVLRAPSPRIPREVIVSRH